MVEEVELKFSVSDYNKIIKKILALGSFKKSAYEVTIMYDNAEKTLFKRDERLRLRKIEDIKTGDALCEISHKKPLTREGIKVEEEHETTVGSYQELEKILSKLGYSKVSSYERIRDTFEVDGCKVTVDSFPFGDLLEVEGSKEKIIAIAEKLEYSMDENITKSCDDIYADLCKKEGVSVNDNILFEGDALERQKELRTSLEHSQY